MPKNTSSKTPLLLDAALFLAAILSRLLFAPLEIDSFDAADFALSLEDFDLLAYRPHFPGYPVYLATARVFYALGLSAPLSLVLPGVLTLAAGAVFVRRAVATLAGDWAGAGASLTLLSLPGLWLASLRPLSDTMGLGLLLIAGSLCVFALRPQPLPSPHPPSPALLPSPHTPYPIPHTPLLAGFFLALTLGVRLSYFPFFLSGLLLFARSPLRWRAAAGFGAGLLLWLVPFAAVVGPVTLVEEGLRFTAGHLDRWGGAVGPDTDFAARGMALLWGAWAYTLGGLWPEDGLSFGRALASLAALLGAGAALVGLWRKKYLGKLSLLLLPYALWVFFGQNPESPRHLLPLLSLLLLASPLGLRRGVALLALGFLAVSLPLAGEYAKTPGPQAALVRYVRENFPPDTRFYGWKTTRLFAYHAPQYEARLSYTLPDLAKDLKNDPAPGEVLFGSRLRQRRRRDRCFEVVRSFRRSRYLEPSYSSITLFRDCGPAR